MTPFDVIAAFRGGYPKKCDFCKRRYCQKRWPIPEEAGAWACNECYERWDEEQAMKNVK